MALVTLRDIRLTYSELPLLNDITLHIEPGDRICCVGRNGTGKSTLMKIITGETVPDAGQVFRQQGLTMAHLPQFVPQDLSGSLFDLVASGLGKESRLLAEYHRASAALAHDASPEALERLDVTQRRIDAIDGWTVQKRVDDTIAHMRLDPEMDLAVASAGQKRRALMARALVRQPDLLLLDEPTNHLDIDAIDWLEQFLLSYGGTLFFVTHDRMMVRRLANRIVEMDRGELYNWACDYDTFLDRKQAMIEADETQWAEFERKLSQEEAWLRKGIKARTTRNEGRVRALMSMRAIRRQRVEQMGDVQMMAQEAERSGDRVIDVKGLSFSYGDEPVVKDLSFTLMRGDRVGIIGPNGCGKTTLLRLLLGELEPQEGTVRHGTRLEVAYFDQLRAQLDPDATVFENVYEGRETVLVNGNRRHVYAYLQDFLFTRDRCKSKVRDLSGGERNRLLLARMFTRPSNVLVFDEPTNDLDTETLELLEEMLLGYGGTVLLVSHDRTMLNDVVTSTLAYEGAGRFAEYVGGYDDWVRQRPGRMSVEDEPAKRVEPERAPQPPRPRPETRARRLTFREERELEALPDRIEALESEQNALYERLADPSVYQANDGGSVAQTRERLTEVEAALEAAYARWEDLAAIAESA